MASNNKIKNKFQFYYIHKIMLNNLLPDRYFMIRFNFLTFVTNAEMLK